MKQIFTFLPLLFTSFAAFSQSTLVVDPALATTITVCHLEQQSVLKEIDESEKDIKKYQLLIGLQMEKIKSLQEKTYNYLSTVNAVVKNGKDIVYASQIAKDIAKYQKQAADMAASDPELLIVVAKTEYELISRSADLLLYIYNVALANGEKNLLDNKQRIDLCTHVVGELRRMRALAYAVTRQMKSAQRNGIIKTLNPGGFRYINNGRRTVNNILNNLEYIRNGGH
ncbi:plasmid transfer protein [Bacteroidales bacterium OttesenSCG-928-B11]|nr:plasmid transfer protein [Bacteroidales bacterium OttesenSCG-928-E04]MDL2312559.1 plasmid transfer protein [Bacteroidales bacterium OttesenSCG-928-B11]MDL2325822.1 plasmid transfer protein [Bacteroidales bacterium OttesenSCG-928-A14]